MTTSIKVTHVEFQAACANGCVYGLMKGKRGLYVYAELGEEKEYLPSPKDSPLTNYRIFIGCDLYFAKTKEQLNSGDFEADYLPNITLIIYC